MVATGEAYSVREFLETAFSFAGLDWRKHVEIDPRYFRPTEVDYLLGDSSKIRQALGWQSSTSFEQLVRMMVASDIKLADEERLIHQQKYVTSLAAEVLSASR